MIERLERVDAFAMVLELAMLAAFAASLGELAGPAFARWPGVLIPAFVVPPGVLAPLAAQLARGPRWWVAVGGLVLAAGFALRFAVVGMPGPLLVGSLRERR